MPVMNTKYYLAIDNCTQWFASLVEASGEAVAYEKNPSRHKVNTTKSLLLPTFAIRASVLDNIYSRDVNYCCCDFYGGDDPSYFDPGVCNGGRDCSVWSISKDEFDKIARIVELYPLFCEYQSLIS